MKTFKGYRTIAPFVLFCALAGLLAIGLNRNPSHIPSPLIDKPAPAFSLPSLNSSHNVSSQEMLGKVWLLNVWASWCAGCKTEHPVINSLSSKQVADVIGLNYKDLNADAVDWLSKFGNPYADIAVDTRGQTGIDYGVYGIPETFLIDQQGIIRFKHIGPLTQADVDHELLPLISTLKGQYR